MNAVTRLDQLLSFAEALVPIESNDLLSQDRVRIEIDKIVLSRLLQDKQLYGMQIRALDIDSKNSLQKILLQQACLDLDFFKD